MKRLAPILVTALVGLVGLEATASARPGDGPRDRHGRVHRVDRHARHGYGAPMDTRVEVLRVGSWSPATIIAVRDGQYFVNFDGWSDFFNEWVPEANVRRAGGLVDCEGRPERVQIQWGGGWYPGQLMKVANGQYLVHYDGWSNFFDEWVGPDRVVRVIAAR